MSPFSNAPPAGDVIVPWSHGSEREATHVRSTLLQSSIQTMKRMDLYPRYLELLPEEHHEVVLQTLAPTWIPMVHGHAHYKACDDLLLDAATQKEIGEAVGKKIQHTFLGQLARSARNVGATPWIPVAQFQKLWDRIFEGGGGIHVVKTGPKDCQFHMKNVELLDLGYFRTGFVGVQAAAIQLFCKRSFIKEIPGTRGSGRVSYAASWV